MKKFTNKDNVNHPNHYQGDIKYVSREGLKNGDEDLKKSDWYLNKLIEVLDE